MRLAYYSNYSSSLDHSNLSHAGQVYSDGLEPSTTSKFPQGPHNIVDLTGSSIVTSTLYMKRPASGSCSIEGFHSAIASGLSPILLGIDMPIMKHMIPLNPTTPPIAMFTPRENNAPKTINTIPEIKKFSRRFFMQSTQCSTQCFCYFWNIIQRQCTQSNPNSSI